MSFHGQLACRADFVRIVMGCVVSFHGQLACRADFVWIVMGVCGVLPWSVGL